jgi:hypothetical protein
VATLDDIVVILRKSPAPLTVAEIASEAGSDIRSCDALLWDNPEHFVWQPGHKWTVSRGRTHVRRSDPPLTPDARSPDTPGAAQNQLRAVTLSTGLTIAVDRRPLDSDAVFTVRSIGNRIALTLNSAHEVFTELPMPFAGAPEESSYKQLCEVLLSAWALYEDAIPEGPARRGAQDARSFWGRRVVEMLRESNDD